MKKILHIVEAFGGGVYTFLVELCNQTCDEYDITIAYSKRPQTPKDFEKDFNNKIKFVEIKNFGREINPKKEILAIKEIQKLLKQLKPDIIHMHSSKAGIIGRFAVKNKEIKLFYNPHGWSFLKQDDSKIKRLIYWWIEKIATMKKCTIIGCSNGEYKEALKLSKNSICINNGINIEKIQEDIKELNEKQIEFNKLKICILGRIGYQKNPEMFNNIAEKFLNIQFTWIGDGELKDKLTSKNIQITGWKNRREVIKILNENDIFILPSLWEGLPLSLLEAMYMKKICIVSNVIGNKDVIKNEENGFIANKLEDYVQIINNIISNKKYNIKQIQQNTYEDILNIYNIEKMIDEYRKIYND